jgi:hypothetical protein
MNPAPLTHQPATSYDRTLLQIAQQLPEYRQAIVCKFTAPRYYPTGKFTDGLTTTATNGIRNSNLSCDQDLYRSIILLLPGDTAQITMNKRTYDLTVRGGEPAIDQEAPIEIIKLLGILEEGG